MLFILRPEANMSQLNLPHGTKTKKVEKRKTKNRNVRGVHGDGPEEKKAVTG